MLFPPLFLLFPFLFYPLPTSFLTITTIITFVLLCLSHGPFLNHNPYGISVPKFIGRHTLTLNRNPIKSTFLLSLTVLSLKAYNVVFPPPSALRTFLNPALHLLTTTYTTLFTAANQPCPFLPEPPSQFFHILKRYTAAFVSGSSEEVRDAPCEGERRSGSAEILQMRS